MLLPLHVANDDGREPVPQRYREALATLQSAFSRPARQHWFRHDSGDMLNTLKEHCFVQPTPESIPTATRPLGDADVLWNPPVSAQNGANTAIPGAAEGD